MRKRTLVSGLLSLFSVGFLTGCGNNNAVSVSDAANNTDSADNEDELSIIKNDRLAVNEDKCVGCGKCARIAPDNFEMNEGTDKAQVKSNEINNQSLIDKAVSSCHPQAISQ